MIELHKEELNIILDAISCYLGYCDIRAMDRIEGLLEKIELANKESPTL